MKHITLEQAKELKVGTILYHLQNKNADDSPQRWRVNGKVKLWKRHPEKVQVPMKHGLRQCDYLTENDLDVVSLSAENISAYQKLKEKHPELNWIEAEEIADDDLITAAFYFDELK